MKNEKLTVCIGQIEVEPAQPRKNTEKILQSIRYAKKKGVDLIVFPEMSVPGYVIGDTWERNDFIEECIDCENEIIGMSNGITVAFGNISCYENLEDPAIKNEDGRSRKYNSCIIAQNKNKLQSVFKTLQPNYRLFDDNRHFYDQRKHINDLYLMTPESFKSRYPNRNKYEDLIEQSYTYSAIVKGYRIGFLLCEDCWDTDYSFSPLSILSKNCDIIVNLSCSPFTMGKNEKRDRVFSAHAKKYQKPILYVNNVGVQNNGKTIYTFDGNSAVYNTNGYSYNACNAMSFDEAVSVIEMDKYGVVGSNCWNDEFLKNKNQKKKKEILDLYKCLCYGIKTFMEQNGIKKVVIGASGGIDSAVVAALVHSIMPNPQEDLYLVNMPTKFNSKTTKSMAELLAKNLNVKYYVVPIEESATKTRNQLQDLGFEINNFVFENIQARDRSARVLAAIASSVGGVFTCNANKSETTVGYCTMYGDLGGFMAPLADVWKTQVYDLARYINELSDSSIIPIGTIEVKPSAELSDNQNVEKDLGDPLIYEYHDLLFKTWTENWKRCTPADILQWVVDKKLEERLGFEDGDIVAKYFKNDMSLFINDLERWWDLYDGFAYIKRIQAPPILAVSRRAYGFDLRESITKPFYSKKYLQLKQKLLNKNKGIEEIKEKYREIFEALNGLTDDQINDMAYLSG